MSYVAKGEKDYDATGAQIPAAKTHKIRITLTSSNVANLEKCKLFISCLQQIGLLRQKSRGSVLSGGVFFFAFDVSCA
jgi:hypothetical protein